MNGLVVRQITRRIRLPDLPAVFHPARIPDSVDSEQRDHHFHYADPVQGQHLSSAYPDKPNSLAGTTRAYSAPSFLRIKYKTIKKGVHHVQA